MLVFLMVGSTNMRWPLVTWPYPISWKSISQLKLYWPGVERARHKHTQFIL